MYTCIGVLRRVRNSLHNQNFAQKPHYHDVQAFASFRYCTSSCQRCFSFQNDEGAHLSWRWEKAHVGTSSSSYHPTTDGHYHSSAQSTKQPFVGRTCTSSVATCQPALRDESWVMREWDTWWLWLAAAVTKWNIGDRVLTSCITACGTCDACQKHLYAFCSDGGWQLGHTMDGMQAEHARIPHADHTAHALPASVPLYACRQEDPYVMASDILPTSWEIAS
jgi:hypothetical protein